MSQIILTASSTQDIYAWRAKGRAGADDNDSRAMISVLIMAKERELLGNSCMWKPPIIKAEISRPIVFQ